MRVARTASVLARLESDAVWNGFFSNLDGFTDAFADICTTGIPEGPTKAR